MTERVDGSELIDRLRRSLGAASDAPGGATARLATVLEIIGWRGGDAASAEEVAQELLPALIACARDHGEPSILYRQVAEVLRGAGPLMDGGLPPTSAYQPAAVEIVQRFVGVTVG